MIEGVDPHDPSLLPCEAAGLKKAIEKYDEHIRKGQINSAHGCREAIMIIWEALKGDFRDTDPNTQRVDI